ncbi:hypothetical protein ABEB36_000468 [Hypothenemus hampei]|uniref:Tectonic-1 n=1 Tax=Hypothenemus hampei TaxID=57062 RepID=A0ABD1FBD1_HYPHA
MNIILIIAWLSWICGENVTSTNSSTTSFTTTENAFTTVTTSSTLCQTNDDGNCTIFNITTTEEPVKIGLPIHQDHEIGISDVCTCNLQFNICDINCCCDPDCSQTDKRIFQYCQIESNSYLDDRYCHYTKLLYINNTQFHWQVDQNGLFCVVRSNKPESYLVQNDMPIAKVEDLKQEYEFWPYEHSNGNHVVKFRYSFGDPIIIIRNDSTLDFLNLPINLLTQSCQFSKDVFYLNNLKTVCSQKIQEENVFLKLETFFQDFKIMANGSTEPWLCSEHFTNCTKIYNGDMKFTCFSDVKRSLRICHNVVKSINLRFYHNGTNGLKKVIVLGVLTNVSYPLTSGSDSTITQSYSVEFLWINQTKNYSKTFSGNPGYIIAKPILIGQKLNRKNDTFIQRKERFVDNFMTFPEPIGETHECVRNESFYVPLEFGTNLLTRCTFNRLITIHVKQNASSVCQGVQEEIYRLWGVSNNSLVYGYFGNALTTRKDDWGEVLYDITPRAFLNFTRGNFTVNSTNLQCFNLSTSVNIQIIYSRIRMKMIHNQAKIVGIKISFLNAKNESFPLKENKFNVSFRLISQVSFHDATTDVEKHYVDPPGLDFRLPYDFFYPFVKIDNSGSKAHLSNIILVVGFEITFALFLIRN